MAIEIFPYEGSNRHIVTDEGAGIIAIPQHPALPTLRNPLLMPPHSVKAYASAVRVWCEGPISTQTVVFDRKYGVIVLQDLKSSDIILQHLDLLFDFQDVLIEVLRNGTTGGALSTPVFLAMLSRFVEDWLRHNPRALVSALVTARYRRFLDPGQALGPDFGHFAIGGYEPAFFEAALGDGKELRVLNTESNPFKTGHVEYYVDPLVTDEALWGVRMTGSIALRFTSNGVQPIISLSGDFPDNLELDTSWVQGIPRLPGAITIPTRADVNGVGIDDEGTPTPSKDGLDPEDPIVDPEVVFAVSAKKVLINNFLTGMANFAGHAGVNDNQISYMTATGGWDEGGDDIFTVTAKDLSPKPAGAGWSGVMDDTSSVVTVRIPDTEVLHNKYKTIGLWMYHQLKKTTIEDAWTIVDGIWDFFNEKVASANLNKADYVENGGYAQFVVWKDIQVYNVGDSEMQTVGTVRKGRVKQWFPNIKPSSVVTAKERENYPLSNTWAWFSKTGASYTINEGAWMWHGLRAAAAVQWDADEIGYPALFVDAGTTAFATQCPFSDYTAWLGFTPDSTNTQAIAID